MGSIAAVADLKNLQAGEKTAEILWALKHRGSDHIYLIQDNGAIDIADNTDATFRHSAYAIGFNVSNKIDGEILPEDTCLAIDGETYGENKGRFKDINGMIDRSDLKGSLEKIVGQQDGAYSLAALSSKGVFAGRDPLGCKPLYYGFKCGVHALASERKGLWALGFDNVLSVPPGSVIRLDEEFEVKHVFTLVKPSFRVKSLEEAASRSAELLRLAVSRRVDDENEVAVAFSGGIDSTIIAYLLDELNVKMKLYTLSIGDRPEVQQAIEAAEALEASLKVVYKSPEEVKSCLSKVLWLIEEPNTLKLEIAIPIFMVAQEASRDGLKALFLGQGGDELFAGYKRFADIYYKHGEAEVEHEIYLSIMDSYLNNFQRDEPLLTTCRALGRYPFYDLKLVDYALSIPASLNLGGGGVLRKKVLRKAGRILGLPEKICDSPKRAIQYGSGVHKAIRGIAHNRGLGSSRLVKEEFMRIFPPE